MENPMNPSEHLSGDQLSDLAEGIATALEKNAYDIHLNQCTRCQNELSVLKSYFQDIHALPTTPAPANFLSNVRARIEKPSVWKNFLAQLLVMRKWVPAQIALLTLLGVGIVTTYLYQGRGNLGTTVSVVEEVKTEVEKEVDRPAPQFLADAEQSKDVTVLSGRRGNAEFKSIAGSKPKGNLSAAPPEAIASNEISESDASTAAGMAAYRITAAPALVAPAKAAPAPTKAVPEVANAPATTKGSMGASTDNFASSSTASDEEKFIDEPVAAKKSEAVMQRAELSHSLDITLHLDKTKDLKSFLSQSEALGISPVLKLADRAIQKKSKARSTSEQNLEFEISLDQSQAWISLLQKYGQVDSIQPLSASKTTIWLRIIQP